MQTQLKWILCAALLMPLFAHADKTTKAGTAESTDKSAMTDTGDRKFVEKAAAGGMAEVRMGKLAMERATTPEVKAFGKRMVDDHSKANDELKALASKKNLAVPTDITSEDKATYERLAKMSGKDFDKAYIDAMVKDHDEDVQEFKKQSQAGADPDLKAWAGKTLQVLEQHDHLAHQDKSTLK
jgi:putative membrane protein